MLIFLEAYWGERHCGDYRHFKQAAKVTLPPFPQIEAMTDFDVALPMLVIVVRLAVSV